MLGMYSWSPKLSNIHASMLLEEIPALFLLYPALKGGFSSNFIMTSTFLCIVLSLGYVNVSSVQNSIHRALVREGVAVPVNFEQSCKGSMHPSIYRPYTSFFCLIFPANVQILHLSIEISNKGSETYLKNTASSLHQRYVFKR